MAKAKKVVRKSSKGDASSASASPTTKVHKVVHLIVSIGDDDRGHTHEEFVEEILGRMQPVKYGEPGLHMTISGGHYIIDGKVCLPGDYDPERKNFKPGAMPPIWAGGTAPRQLDMKTRLEHDLASLTPDEYDRKYQIGKYAPEKTKSERKVITPAEQKAMREQWIADKQAKEDDDIEFIDIDAADAAASASEQEAIKKVKKRTVKKTAKPAAKKRTIKRGKK